MNRTIKFRAWDNDNRKMSDTFGLFSTDGGYLSSTQNFSQGSWDIMQFTGLTDKNGKEIYSGDLLNCDDGKVREVMWYDLGAGWRVGTDDKDTYFNGLGVYADKLEVIGNIYENLELLTNK